MAYLARTLSLSLVALLIPVQSMAVMSNPDDSEIVSSSIGIYSKDDGYMLGSCHPLRATSVGFCGPHSPDGVPAGSLLPPTCHSLDPGIFLACDPNPGVFTGPDAAVFEVDSWNPETGAGASWGRQVDVVVTFRDGQHLGGFAAVGCTDFDNDFDCDNGSVGFSDDDCGSGKDQKDCNDPTQLRFSFCAEKDRGASSQYDDFLVFIYAWVNGDSPNAGASTGQFLVEVDWGAFLAQGDCESINGL